MFDLWSPRERGLMLGHQWAEGVHQAAGGILRFGEASGLDPLLAAAHKQAWIAQELRRWVIGHAHIGAQLVEEPVFWEAFRASVATYLLDLPVGEWD